MLVTLESWRSVAQEVAIKGAVLGKSRGLSSSILKSSRLGPILTRGSLLGWLFETYTRHSLN